MAEQGAAQQQAVEYVSKARFDRLVEYVNDMARNFNTLSEQVEKLENFEQTRQRLENEAFARKQQKNQGVQRRNPALEEEADDVVA